MDTFERGACRQKREPQVGDKVIYHVKGDTYVEATIEQLGFDDYNQARYAKVAYYGFLGRQCHDWVPLCGIAYTEPKQ